MEGEKMIRIKGVNKYFGNTQVLKNINVEINKGEIFGLVGHSGAENQHY